MIVLARLSEHTLFKCDLILPHFRRKVINSLHFFVIFSMDSRFRDGFVKR